MKLIIYTVLALLATALITVWLREDPGYLLISFRGSTMETTAVMFAAIALLAFAALYIVVRLISAIMPGHIRKWRRRRGMLSGQNALTRGLLELDQGHWHEAERHMITALRNPKLAALGYLGAARAAQAQGATARRDGYFKSALRRFPKSQVALTVSYAQLLGENGQPQQGVQVLKQLPPNQFLRAPVQRLLSNLYTDLKDWPSLVNTLPRLRHTKALSDYNYYQLEHIAYSGLVNHMGRSQDVPAMWKVWQHMPRRLREKEDITMDFACSLIHCGRANEAEDVLYTRITRKWSDSLVYIYGLLDGDAEIHLARGRNWLAEHGENPVLLLTLGRLANRAHQWDKAREYLEGSLKITPNAETYQELGNLLVFVNEPAHAIECYRRGLAMTTETFFQPEIKTGVVERAKLPRPKPALIDDFERADEVAPPLESQTNVESLDQPQNLDANTTRLVSTQASTA